MFWLRNAFLGGGGKLPSEVVSEKTMEFFPCEEVLFIIKAEVDKRWREREGEHALSLSIFSDARLKWIGFAG